MQKKNISILKNEDSLITSGTFVLFQFTSSVLDLSDLSTFRVHACAVKLLNVN